MKKIFSTFYQNKHAEYLNKYLFEIQHGNAKVALGYLRESNTYLKEFKKLNKETHYV